MIQKNIPTRLIAIDYGLARIGLAFSDERKIIATPLKVIQSPKKLMVAVQLVVETLTTHQKEMNYAIEGIIVGMPLMMSGKTGLMADEVNVFIEELKKHIPDTKIISWDERLTSVQAERSMREANMSRKRRSKSVDSVSAVIILQSYLDHLSLFGA
jgi:putative Holliday junction resolvase